MSILLFLYGTLHPDRAPSGIAHAARKLKPIGSATIRGRLLHLGEYPGLLLCAADHPDACDVIGNIFEVPDAATLEALDAYEDFRPAEPQASLFLRVEAQATLTDGSLLTCWVYVYNR